MSEDLTLAEPLAYVHEMAAQFAPGAVLH